MKMDYFLYVMLLSWIFLLLGAWMHNRTNQANLGMRFGFRKESVMGYVSLCVALSLMATFISGWFLVDAAEKHRRTEFERAAMGLTPTFAFELQQIGHANIKLGTSLHDPVYEMVSEKMNKWLSFNAQFMDMYTLRKTKTGVYYLVVDSQNDSNQNGKIDGIAEERNSIGRLYQVHNQEMDAAFAGKTTIESKPTEGKWGYTLSAYAPIYDQNGQVESIVALVYDGRKWEGEIQLERLKVMGFLLVPYVFILMIYWGIFRYRLERGMFRYQQNRFEKSEERFRKLSEATFEAIIIHRLGVTLEINEAFTKMFGYTREEVLGTQALLFAIPEDRELIQRNIVTGIEETYEVRGLRKDGSVFFGELVGKIIEYEGTSARVAAIRDISLRKQAEEQIRYMAYHDEMTNLANRKMFLERVKETIRVARKNHVEFAVMFLDLDRFKMINDIFGHAAGDQLLRTVANRLVCAVSKEATIARLGADEFTLLIPGIRGEEHAERIAQDILDVITQPIEISGREMTISASMGISTYPNSGLDVDSLMRNADTAMYRAKDMGTHSYQFYTAEMGERAFERLSMEQDLRMAIERDELLLHYQPQIDIQTGQIIGVEALLRWKHHELGMISPTQFIPLAEETQLIIPIGEWVLRTACKQNKQWQQSGFPQIRVAVNLSAYQFQNSDLIQLVSEILEETRLEPKFLELEITESIAMQNVHQVIEILNQLKMLGIEISMDDFGTGYSSLNYLKHFPIHRLKIDRSFVNDITTDPLDAVIATSIIAMAHSLGLRVIAEGVETKEQFQFLQEKECDEMQGFYYSRPLPKEQLEELLVANQVAQ